MNRANFALGNNSTFLEGRYAFGLSNLSNDPDDKIKTRGIQLMAGIGFPRSSKKTLARMLMELIPSRMTAKL